MCSETKFSKPFLYVFNIRRDADNQTQLKQPMVTKPVKYFRV